MNEIRVLVLTTMYPNVVNRNSGIFIHKQIKHLLKSNCRVKVISPIPYSPKVLWFKAKWKSYGDIPAVDVVDEVPVYYPRYINLPGKWFHSYSSFSIYYGIMNVVDSIMRSFRPHIIHTHAATAPGYVGLLLKKKYNLPLVCSLRGSDINIYPHYGSLSMRLTKKLISGADQLVSVSNELKYRAAHLGKPKVEIQVLHNGCDLGIFGYRDDKRKEIRNQMGIAANESIILFVGNILKTKGVVELITAFRILKEKHPLLHLILIGDGPEISTIDRMIRDTELRKNIHLVGQQPENIVAKYMSAADIFVLPTHYEGLPNAVLEAMACGLPVVATGVGGIPEAVEDGKSGILIDRKDVPSLVTAIQLLIENRDLARQMGAHGSKIVENKFIWEQNAAKLKGIYKHVLKKDASQSFN